MPTVSPGCNLGGLITSSPDTSPQSYEVQRLLGVARAGMGTCYKCRRGEGEGKSALR